MVSVPLPADRVRARLIAPWDGRLAVAAVNGPASAWSFRRRRRHWTSCSTDCDQDGVRARRIAVDYASHSAQVERIEKELPRPSPASSRARPRYRSSPP